MKGYIFEYYNYLRYTEDSLKNLQENKILDYKRANRSILTFGEYDRLKINTIYDFTRYRDLSDLAKNWIGNRRSVLLYELDNSSDLTFKDIDLDSGEGGFYVNKSQDDHLFWALTEFPFRSSVRNYEKSYHEILENARETIKKTVRELPEINYEVLGTLGIFGIVILWFGNQVTDILDIVDQIKRDSSLHFLSAHTIISKNPFITVDDTRIDQIQGDAIVQVTLKKHLAKPKSYNIPTELSILYIQ